MSGNLKSLKDLMNEVFTPEQKDDYEKNKIKRDFRTEILVYRKEEDLSRKEFANKIGITEEKLGKIETGEEKIDLELMIDVLDIMGKKLIIENNSQW